MVGQVSFESPPEGDGFTGYDRRAGVGVEGRGAAQLRNSSRQVPAGAKSGGIVPKKRPRRL